MKTPCAIEVERRRANLDSPALRVFCSGTQIFELFHV